MGRCVHRGFVLPHGRVCFVQGESPVKLFGKLFGKSARQEGGSGSARHRAPRQPDESGAAEDRPLFRDEVGGPSGGTARVLLTPPCPAA